MHILLNSSKSTLLQIFYQSYTPLPAKLPLKNLVKQSKHTLMFLKSPKHFKVGKHKMSVFKQRGISHQVLLLSRNLLSLILNSNRANFQYLQKRITFNTGGVSTIRKFYLTIPCQIQFYGW